MDYSQEHSNYDVRIIKCQGVAMWYVHDLANAADLKGAFDTEQEAINHSHHHAKRAQ